MNREVLRDYIRNNLKIKWRKDSVNNWYISLFLEDEIISEIWVERELI